MTYEVTDNRIKIKKYFFEMDTKHNLYIYGEGLKLLEKINIGKNLSYLNFKSYCETWIINNKN